MMRVIFSGSTALEAIKAVYGWMAENQVLANATYDVVVNRQEERWEAVVYVNVRNEK